jgi:cathepsin F
MECDATQDSKSNRSDCGIFGGWPYLAMDYVQKEGLSTEETYPYCLWFEPKDRCKPCSPEGYDDKKCGPGLHPPMCKIESPCKKDAKKEVFIDGYISVS